MQITQNLFYNLVCIMFSENYSDFINEKSRRHKFLGANIDLYKMEETLDLIGEVIRNRDKVLQSDINVAKFVSMRSDAVLNEAVQKSDLINIDGMGIYIGCKLLGVPVEEKVSGVDLMMNLLKRCQDEGFRPYFFGAKQEVVEQTVRKVQEQFPKINVAGFRNGYFSDADEPDIIDQINAAQADCLFVGISTPKKEVFLYKYRERLNVPYLMGVGGAFDVVAGKVKRAPLWMQNSGLEWFYRFLQEPGRMWKRYLSTNSEFGLILLRALFARNILRRNVHTS